MSTLRSVMQTDLRKVKPSTPVRDAVKLLVEHHISGLPVVDDDDMIVGVLSEKDLLRVFYEDVKTVADIMTPKPEALSVDAPLVEAFDMLMANDFRRVLIHDNGKLAGLISRADLMPAVLEAIAERG